MINLMIMPMIIYLAALVIGTSSIAINSVIIMTALPASAMNSILAEFFDLATNSFNYIVNVMEYRGIIAK